MNSIYEIKAKKTMTAPGVWDYEAEAKVTGPDTAEEVFVYAATDSTNKTFKVDGESIMAALSEDASDGNDQDFDDAIMKFTRGELSQEEIKEWGFDKAADGYAEEYDKLSAAKDSKYYGVFKVLNGLLGAMSKEVG